MTATTSAYVHVRAMCTLNAETKLQVQARLPDTRRRRGSTHHRRTPTGDNARARFTAPGQPSALNVPLESTTLSVPPTLHSFKPALCPSVVLTAAEAGATH